MRPFSRVALVAMVSVVLVSIGIGVGVYLAGAGSEAPGAKVTISKPVAFEGEVPARTARELTATSARAFRHTAVEVAGELVTVQTIANVVFFTDSMAALEP